VERSVDELPDGAGTDTALRAAAETTIDIACVAACHSARGGPHFMFAQDVAGTDNHYKLWRFDRQPFDVRFVRAVSGISP